MLCVLIRIANEVILKSAHNIPFKIYKKNHP